MRKKILIAEKSDATRSVAENVMRQNGYEVISVTSAEKALEVLGLSRPNLILVDSELVTKGKKPFYQKLQEEQGTSSIPFLLLAEAENSLPFPDEVIVTRPLDPKDLMTKVNALAGDAQATARAGSTDLMNDSGLEDELLDAALGLDRIDVTESEVMDNTTTGKAKKKTVEKMIGLDHEIEEDRSSSDKIEALRIDEDSTEIKQQNRPPQEGISKGTGKLEILSDHEQFGLGDESLLEPSSEYANHDYEWFIKEMKKDATQATPSPTSAKSKSSKRGKEDLKVSQPGSQVDRVSYPSKKTADSGKVSKAQSSGGVEKFIEDFKKEVERFSDPSTPPQIIDSKPAKPKTSPGAAPAPPKPSNVVAWEDTVEKLSESQLDVLTRQLVSELAEKLANKISSKLDSQKLLSLIKSEIVDKVRNLEQT